MKATRIYVFGILAMVVTLGVGVWLISQPKQMEPIKRYVTTSLSENSATVSEVIATEAPEATETTASTSELTPEERALKGKETFLAMMEFTGVDMEDDYWKLLHEAVNSPEYIEYQKKQDERIGIDLDLWWSFLESKGLSSGRMAQEERFREHFPTGDYADYEPEMRERLAELFLESGLSATATNDDRSVKQTIDVLSQFRGEDEAHRVWMRGHFKGYVGDLEWAQEIRKNAASIVAGVERVDPVPTFTESDTVAEPVPTQVAEENLDNESQPALFGEDALVLGDFEQVPQTTEGIEVELLKTLFPNVPEFQTEIGVENVLREQFSVQRLSTAMQTLNRYGPEKGMQRLKESDPEVATYVERLLQTRQENSLK